VLASLISIPIADVCMPPLGISQIKGYLNENSDIRVKCYDLSIDYFYYCTDKNRILDRKEFVKRRLEDLNNTTDINKYKYFFECDINSDYICENIEEAVNALKDKNTYGDWLLYEKYSSIFERALKLYSACYYPSIVSREGIEFAKDTNSSENVESYINNEKENPLIDFYYEKLESIIQEDTMFVGISVNYFNQVIPALTLASIIKRYNKNIKIIGGGSLFPSYMEDIYTIAIFAKYFDAVIPFSGENPWLEILTKKSINNISGCLVSDGMKFIGERYSSAVTVRSLPCFEDFVMNKYFTPEVVLPYVLCVGCYWKKCRFCSYEKYEDKQIKKSSLNDLHIKAINDLKKLNSLYGAKNFYFVDEAIPPIFAKNIAKYNSDNNLGFSWYGEMRLESYFDDEYFKTIKEGGCGLLFFGFESASTRVLDLMQKGTKVEDISKIFALCGKYKIKNMPMFFIGFPTETKEEAEMTINLVRENIDNIQYASTGTFMLLKSIPVHESPERYHIRIIDNKGELANYDNYKALEGITRRESEELVKSLYTDDVLGRLMDFVLISRNHLLFLPFKKEKINRINIVDEKNYTLEKHCRVINSMFDWFNGSFSIEEQIYIFNELNDSIYLINKEDLCFLNRHKGVFTLRDIFNEKYYRGKIASDMNYLYKEGVIIESN